jgi:hypothetical protein
MRFGESDLRRAAAAPRRALHALAGAGLLLASAIGAAAQVPFIPNNIVTSTVPKNGDLNPYGVAFVPQGFPAGGKLAPGEILVANFNNSKNLQGTGTTIVRVTPNGVITPGPAGGVGTPGTASVFFQGANLGLDTALAVLKEGFVIVGNFPSKNGLYATRGPGSLLVLDGSGKLVTTIPASKATKLNGPWDMTVFDQGGGKVQAFVTNAGNPHNGFVTRLDVTLSPSPTATSTIIANGYTVQPNSAAFVFGPTGLVYDPATDTLYVASTADNAVFKVNRAGTRTTSAGQGTMIFSDKSVLRGPLGMAAAPNGDLIVANGDGVNGDPTHPSEYVEFTKTGTSVGKFNIDQNQGGAFGIAVDTGPNGEPRLAVVDDNVPTLNIFTGLPPSINAATR